MLDDYRVNTVRDHTNGSVPACSHHVGEKGLNWAVEQVFLYVCEGLKGVGGGSVSHTHIHVNQD